jgi:hypothetical protein
MRFSKNGDGAHVFLECSEEERKVLRAIVKASFELARPVGLSVLDYRSEHNLSDSEADQWIRSEPRKHDSRVIDMDFVQGRQCKTVLSKEAPGHFRLDTRLFERYRRDCVPMLERAQNLMSQDGSLASDDRLPGSAEVKIMAAAV